MIDTPRAAPYETRSVFGRSSHELDCLGRHRRHRRHSAALGRGHLQRLVRLRALVKEGFSGITVQLRRRADLIPNLVSTVEGYATHERETLTQVIEHRGDAVTPRASPRPRRPTMRCRAMLGRLMAVAEAYPDLKANENFQQLQAELTEIEEASAERAALLQRDGARSEHQHPVLPQRADRPPDGLPRGGILHRHRRLDPGRRPRCSSARRRPERMTRTRPLLALLLAALALFAPASSQAAKPVPDDRDRAGRCGARSDRSRRPALTGSATAIRPGYGERILSYPQRRRRRRRRHADRHRDDPGQCRGRRYPPRHLSRLPDQLSSGDGRRVRVGFDVQSVTAGRPARALYAPSGSATASASGSATRTPHVERGQHTYVLRYTTTRQLGFFDGYDELYWNVTGNGWRFPIDRAEVRIRLPQAVAVRPGARLLHRPPRRDRRATREVVSERPGEIVIRTTERLGSREGFTVAVRWQKGVVDRAAAALPGAALVPGLCAARGRGLGAARPRLLLLLCLEEGRAAGRSRARSCRSSRRPTGSRAAAVRYIRRMGFDNRCFAAAIVDSGVHGQLRMEEGEKGFLTEGQDHDHPDRRADGPCRRPETRMLSALFAGGDSIEMDKSNHLYFGNARKALRGRPEGGLSRHAVPAELRLGLGRDDVRCWPPCCSSA